MDEDELERLKEIRDDLATSIDSQWTVPAYDEAMGELEEFIEEVEK